jgi:glycosyltransferase involved in cell wall biosynthesis
MKEVYAVADTVVVNSKYEENALINAGLTNTVFIPVGLDMNRLKTFQNPGMKDGRYRIACMAQDVPLIDFPSVIKGFGIAAKADPSFMFGIFSDQSQLNMWNFNDMFDVYGLKDRCVIMNPQPETNFGFPSMGEVYTSSDLIVAPHQEDILNISAIEADYCGTKVLTSSFGPTKEYLSDKAEYLEKTDIYYALPMNSGYRMFDAQEIADKIIFLSMKSRGSKSKKDSKPKLDRFSWEKIIDNWIELF